MKKLLLLGVGSALMFTMGGVGPALADGGPHVSGAASGAAVGGTVVIVSDNAGKCAACHRAHTAKGEYNLVQAQPALCYSCHNGTAVSTTVVNVGQAPDGTGLRGGGFETAAISTGGARSTWTGSTRSNPSIPVLTTPEAVTSKHQIGTPGTAWGNGINNSGLGASVTLECTSCHDPHGNKNFRILKGQPVDSGVKGVTARAAVAATPLVNNADGTITPAQPGSAARVAVADTMPVAVNIPDTSFKNYTTVNYWLTGDATVPLNGTPFTAPPSIGAGVAPDGYIQNIAAWCTTCHTRYLAGSGSYNTPSGDNTFMYRHRSDANYKQGAANCITCHVSHGSNAVMNNANMGASADVKLPGGADAPHLTKLVGGVAVDAGPDSRLLRVNNRGTCEMCHNV